MAKIDFADSSAFANWYRSLSLAQRIAIDNTLYFVGLLEDLSAMPKKLYKQLFSGISELRLGKTLGEALLVAGMSASTAIGLGGHVLLLRIFYHDLSTRKLLILSGYDKAADLRPTRQKAEIRQAIAILENWLLQNDVF